jgi:hypothetical protein
MRMALDRFCRGWASMGMDLLSEPIWRAIQRLENGIPQTIQNLFVGIRMQGGWARVKFLEGILSILIWHRENRENLEFLNEGTLYRGILSTAEQWIRMYMIFLNSLRYKNLADIGVESKQWQWFILYAAKTYGVLLQIDEVKVLQAKELQKARGREKKEIPIRKHISLDLIDPEALYSAQEAHT